jgi:two-component system, NtrC family, sensor histidine kinase HydH
MNRLNKGILYSIWTRYKFVPLYVKVIPIIIMLGVIFSLDMGWVLPSLIPQEILHRLYFLPIILSGLLFGFSGGLLSAVAVTFLFLPHWLDLVPSPLRHKAHIDELILFYAFGILIGLLVDRERMETRLRQEKEHLAAIGEAVATVAHELKNPVITMGAYAQKILKQTEPGDPNRERLAVIGRECQRIEVLLKDMIHFSRPIAFESSHVDINLLLEEIQKILYPQAEQKQIMINFDQTENLPSIQGDQSRLTQVLYNLILNAIQASASGQTVLVRTRKQKGQLLVEISDSGCGIPVVYQERIFHPFFSTKKDGSGLGLAVSKKIIELHQGRLFFQDNKPQGAVFTISLPLSKKSFFPRPAPTNNPKRRTFRNE